MRVLTYDELIREVERLLYGKSFTVGTEGERKQVLMIARAQGKRITSRKNGKGGFQIIALE